jgi:glycerophosphoryl diester phosphodiesterase
MACIVAIVQLKGNNEVNENKNTINKYNFSNLAQIKKVKVIAHRGQCLGEVENSMSAIKSSIKYKVDYAEIDVQETSDGVVVLMHDRSLKRLTGLNKNVDQLTFAQIEKQNIAAKVPGDMVERVPTLEQVIKECEGKLNLIIEIKPYANTTDLTNKVVNIINKNNFVNQCKVHSLSYKILLNVKQLNPNIQTGYIIGRPISNIGALNVNFFSVEEKAVNSKMIEDIHKSNKEIYVWTVDKKSDMNNLLKLNIDGIITDKPLQLMNIKKSINSEKI